MELNQVHTVGDSREYLHQKRDQGVSCPFCDQYVKLYRRKINRSNAMCLIEFFKIWKRDGPGWYHISDLIKENDTLATRLNGGEFARMRLFGLIEEKKKDDEDTHKRTSGYWRLTREGEMFILGKITKPDKVHIYNGQVMGFSETQTTIKQALGKSFNYEKLMGDYLNYPDDDGQFGLPI